MPIRNEYCYYWYLLRFIHGIFFNCYLIPIVINGKKSSNL